jgi:secretion/DNA translocation related CpaE-like protein
VRGGVLLVSRDVGIVDDVLRLAAARGAAVRVCATAQDARERWRESPVALVGADMIGELARDGLPRRPDVVVIATEEADGLDRLADAVGAEHVAVLPRAERWLMQRLGSSTPGERAPRDVLVFVGAGQGAGASTCAATVARIAARDRTTTLVDLDPLGGGIDLLLGIEDVSGTRWPELVSSHGRIDPSDLRGSLPHRDGLAVLSWSREAVDDLAPHTVDEVLEACVRASELVVVDLVRPPHPLVPGVLSRASLVALVTTDHVRALAAARRVAHELACHGVELVAAVRAETHLDADGVLRAAGVPIVARLPRRSRATATADAGDPPPTDDACARALRPLLERVVL